MKDINLRQFLGILLVSLGCCSIAAQPFGVLDNNAVGGGYCPPQETILPCRCSANGEEIQIWCSHSDLPRVMLGLKSVTKIISRPIDELILENNNLPSLPGRIFSALKVVRLMLRHNNLERLSSGWLMDTEDHLVEIYIVENSLRSIPYDSLSGMRKLEAVTIQSENLKHIPDFSNLPKLRYISLQSASIVELPPQAFQHLMSLDTLIITESVKLTRLEAGLLQDLPRLHTVTLSNNGITWIHLRTFSGLPQLRTMDLSGNRITDVSLVGRAVKDLRGLEVLKLDTNRIALLPEGSFVDLPSLKELYLNQNVITEIRQGAFHRTPKLKLVRLENNYLRRVHPESFLQASGSGVEILHLQENEITRAEELRSLLDALPTLKFLDLSFNKLEFIPYGALHGHGTIEQLYLDNNQIRMIDRDAFMAMPALRELRLKNNSLSDMLPTPFWNLPSLKGLDLSGNNFQRVEPELLMGLPSLRRLDMSSNSIKIISPNTFMRTTMLETINMSKNYVETIYPPTFRSLDRLYEVDLSHNNLREFIPGLPRVVERVSLHNNKIETLPSQSTRDLTLPNLRMLDISRNIIQRIPPSSFQEMRQLRSLNFAKNELQQIEDGSLHGLDRLETLNLQDNRLRMIHENGFASMSQLDDVNIQGNRLDEISNRLFDNAVAMKRLDLSRNNIMHIPPNSFRNARSIQALDLSSNKLRDIPDSLGRLNDLREIDVSLNKLTNLPAEIINSWPKLEELRVASNMVTEIRTGLVRNLPDLQYLDLSSNEIFMMEPGAIRDLPQLQEIVLADNRLRELPDRAFDDLPSLQAVHLQENALSALSPETFYRTPSMVYLNLSSNNLHNIESAGLRSVRSLEVLDLSNNDIRRVSQNPLRRLDWLVELNLDNNRICRVQGEPFATMPRLRILTMRNNRVTSLPESTFRNLRSNIAVLDLDGNPLECTCNMMWYRSWLQESDSQTPGPRCGNGKMLRELPLSRSDCEVFERNNQLSMPLTNEHGDLFARQALDTAPCDGEPFEELKSGLPPPEESEYFDQFVDYPSTNDTAEPNTDEESPPPPPPPDKSSQSPFSDHHPHPPQTHPNSGKNFNHSNTLLNPNQPPRPHHPQEQPFSIFGIPIPSFGQLFGQGRHANGRATSSRGRGRVQLYRNDDPELLKLLNKNEVQVGIGGGRPSAPNHPNGLQNRPLFQTSFHEPATVQKGGFTPILPGEGGFKPMDNGTKEEDDLLGHRNETTVDEGVDDEQRFQEVLTVAQAEKPRIKISNKNDQIVVADESAPNDHSFPETDDKIELGQPIDLPNNEIPPPIATEPAPPSKEPEEVTSLPVVVAEEESPAPPPLSPESPSFEPTDLELDYYDRELEVQRQKTNEKLSWDNKDPQRNELLSALVAPGAQQGIYRTPPGRSTITKVFTPSPSGSIVVQSTTNAPVVPSPEEYYRADPHQDYSSTEVHPVAPSRGDTYNSKASPDWYFETYNKTDTPKMYPKRSYDTSGSSGGGHKVPSHHGYLRITSVSLLSLLLHHFCSCK